MVEKELDLDIELLENLEGKHILEGYVPRDS